MLRFFFQGGEGEASSSSLRERPRPCAATGRGAKRSPPTTLQFDAPAGPCSRRAASPPPVGRWWHRVEDDDDGWDGDGPAGKGEEGGAVSCDSSLSLSLFDKSSCSPRRACAAAPWWRTSKQKVPRTGMSVIRFIACDCSRPSRDLSACSCCCSSSSSRSGCSPAIGFYWGVLAWGSSWCCCERESRFVRVFACVCERERLLLV